MQVSMIGDGERGLLELEGAPDQIIDAVSAIQQGIFGVTMEMNEGHLITIGKAP